MAKLWQTGVLLFSTSSSFRSAFSKEYRIVIPTYKKNKWKKNNMTTINDKAVAAVVALVDSSKKSYKKREPI